MQIKHVRTRVLAQYLHVKRLTPLVDHRNVYMKDLKLHMHDGTVRKCFLMATVWNDGSPHAPQYPCKVILNYKFAEIAKEACDLRKKVKIACELVECKKDVEKFGLQAGEFCLLVSGQMCHLDDQATLTLRKEHAKLQQKYRKLRNKLSKAETTNIETSRLKNNQKIGVSVCPTLGQPNGKQPQP